MMNESEIKNRISTFFNDTQLGTNEKNALLLALTKLIQEMTLEDGLKNRLQVLFEYEKHCLETIKAYKDEIKFMASLQEDLRRERSQFFTQTLKEVSNTLKQADVDKDTVSAWIKELVASYTTSLDVSNELATTHITEMVEQIKHDQQQEVSAVNIGSEK